MKPDPTKSFETEFKSRLQAFEADAVACAAHGYAFFAFEYLAGSDIELLERLNEHPGFWQTVSASLQSALFVALGRVFDSRKDSHSASDLLDYARRHPGIFSRESLLCRKMAAGLPSEQAAEFVGTAFEPSKRSFDVLVTELNRQSEIFKARAGPIRSKIYAHTGKITRHDRDKLFTDLMMRDLERLTVFPVRLERALSGLFENGTEPVLDEPVTIIGEVIKKAPDEGLITWEHYHRASEAAAFLRALVNGKLRGR